MHKLRKLSLTVCPILFAAIPGMMRADSIGAGAPQTLAVSRVTYEGINFVNPCAVLGQPDFPYIFNCGAVSGIQGKIHIDLFVTQPSLKLVGSLPLTDDSSPTSIITTSYSSKSEGALMLSPDQQHLSYMGYNGPVGAEGVSNSYTTGSGTNLNGNASTRYDREVAVIGADASISLTPESNAYSGDNPRAAITPDGIQLYMAGNSDSTTYTTGINMPGPGSTIGARYGTITSTSSYQLGVYKATDRPDESTKQHVKDNNFRGIGIYNGNLYVSKGSGGNGDDGVFQVHNGTGDGLPLGAGNTITPLFSMPATDPNSGAASPIVPFGFWFANATTLYVADEGYANTDVNGNLIPDPLAGLQKWSFVNGTWTLDYVLQNGLNLYQAETVTGYPVPTYTYGIRNMTGRVNPDGTVTVYAITAQYSTISGGEPDPTKLVAITDELSAATLPAGKGKKASEMFVVLGSSNAGEVFRGVALAPCGLTAAVAGPDVAGPVDATCTTGN